MLQEEFADFETMTLGEMLENDYIAIKNGHGSAPKDLRVGEQIQFLNLSANISPHWHMRGRNYVTT